MLLGMPWFYTPFTGKGLSHGWCDGEECACMCCVLFHNSFIASLQPQHFYNIRNGNFSQTFTLTLSFTHVTNGNEFWAEEIQFIQEAAFWFDQAWCIKYYYCSVLNIWYILALSYSTNIVISDGDVAPEVFSSLIKVARNKLNTLTVKHHK